MSAAYQVMARKWRPRNFEEMVGQDHVARTIRNAIEGNRIAHAYLFTGTRGVGKTTSARILAKALNCEKGPTATPCEVCASCKGVGSGSSMDVLEIDGASNRGVNEIRELREQVKYAPMQGAYKVYIIDEVHMLTKEAFNALLKTLEEPPPHVVFIFATTEANKVPHTILSRVQRFDFKRISEAQIRERLELICSKEGIAFELEALDAIARKGDGSMRDALSLFDQVYAFSGQRMTFEDARRILGIPQDRLFAQLLNAIVAHDAAVCFKLLSEVYDQGIELGEFLIGFGGHLRDLLYARQEALTAAALGFSEQRFNELRAAHPELRDGDIIRYGKLVSELLGSLRSAPHPRLTVEMGIMRMASLDRIVTLSQVLQEVQNGSVAVGSAETEVKKKTPDLIFRDSNFEPDAAEKKTTFPALEKKSDLGILKTATERLSPTTAILVASEEGDPQERFNEEPPLPDEEEPPRFESLSDSNAKPEIEVFDDIRRLEQHWNSLCEEWALQRPVMAIHLSASRLQIAENEIGHVEIHLAYRVGQEFLNADGESKKALASFLSEKVRGNPPLQIRYLLKTAAPQPETEASLPTPAGRRRLLDEPIVTLLLEMFEGKITSNSRN